MEKDLGYQELFLLTRRLEQRAVSYVSAADQAQAKGMKKYVDAQEKAMAKAKDTLADYRSKLADAEKEILEAADQKAMHSLLEAYGRYGLREK